MKELQELRNEILTLKNLEVLNKQQEQKLLLKINVIEQKFAIKDVVKSLPQDNFCIVCNLPTDGEKCYSKRCPV